MLSIIQSFPMRNPAHKHRTSFLQPWPFRPSKGHVFFVGLLLIAALPAAILTCAIMLPVKLVQWVKG